MHINKYKFEYDNEYIIGYYTTLGQEYDFMDQMSQYPDVAESIQYGGWYKFEDGKFILDEERKALMLKEYETK